MNFLLQLQTPYPLPKLKRLPLREQPAYRVTQDPDGCNLTELLAAVVGGQQQIEIAEALMDRFGDVRALSQAHILEIAAISGIGQATAVRLKASLALGKRLLEPAKVLQTVQSPADAAGILQPLIGHRDQEYLVVMVLNTRNQVLDVVEVYHGSVNQSQVRVAEVFKPAIQLNAPAIIIAHSHPSGDPSPSNEDIAVTRSLIQAGKLLDVETIDHLIIGHGRWISLKEKGLGFGDRALQETQRPYRVREWDVIYTYTRSQALEDGVLVDVTETAKEAGFRLPTAITADLHAVLEPNQRELSYGQSYEGRLWDVIFVASIAARRAKKESQVAFHMSVTEIRGQDQPQQRTLKLWMVIGPGDHSEPVITIGLPEDF